MRVGGQRHSPAALPPVKTRYPLYIEWAPGLVWTGAENLAPNGIRSPDRPARSESLYRLRYPGHSIHNSHTLNDSFGGLVVSMLASGSRVRGFEPDRSRWIFSNVNSEGK
jgi:hypothetical protein